MSVYTNNEKELCCPLCGDNFVHIDQMRMAGRPDGEDGDLVGVGVTHRGNVHIETGNVPFGPTVGEGRRHRIALIGWCENCGGHFALVFTQRKGVTLVESVRMADPDLVPPIPPSQRFTSPDIEPSRTEEAT